MSPRTKPIAISSDFLEMGVFLQYAAIRFTAIFISALAVKPMSKKKPNIGTSEPVLKFQCVRAFT
jgi:hypothetical protein